MKVIFRITFAVVAVAFSRLSGFGAAESEKQMLAEAKVDRAQGQRIALAQTHAGTIKSGELEREKGHLVWSFDIAKGNVPGVSEVLLDAKTGKILSVQKENAAKEAAEAKAEAKGKKH